MSSTQQPTGPLESSPAGGGSWLHRASGSTRSLLHSGREAFAVHVEGAELLPESGPGILAANHRWSGDVTRLFGALERPVTLAVERRGRFTHRRVPIDSHDPSQADASTLLASGELVMIQPEGARSPDGRLHRGSPDVAWLALTARVAVYPVDIVPPPAKGPAGQAVSAMLGPTMRIGEPLDFSRYWTTPALSDALDGVLLRGCTDEIMAAIAELSGQLYDDNTPEQARVRVAEQKRQEKRARALAYPTLAQQRRAEAEWRERLRAEDERDLQRAAQEARARVRQAAMHEGEDPAQR